MVYLAPTDACCVFCKAPSTSCACQITLQNESHFAWIIFCVLTAYRLIKDQGFVIVSMMEKQNYSGIKRRDGKINKDHTGKWLQVYHEMPRDKTEEKPDSQGLLRFRRAWGLKCNIAQGEEQPPLPQMQDGSCGDSPYCNSKEDDSLISDTCSFSGCFYT